MGIMYLIGYDFASKKYFFLNNYDFIVYVISMNTASVTYYSIFLIARSPLAPTKQLSSEKWSNTPSFAWRFSSRMLSVVKGNDAGLKGFQTDKV